MLAMVEPDTHHTYVLLRGVGASQNLAEVVKIAGIAYCDQDVAGAHTHGAAAEFLIAVNTELIELFRLAVALAGRAPLRVCEQDKEKRAEAHARYSGFILGEQVLHC